jgi:two-component system, chemotaxis family, chemotaxis protein CheY
MKRVLIVDDSRAVRLEAAKLLSAAGFEVVEAEDGEAGLLKLDADASIALVILDLNMPRMDGLQLLATMRQRGREVPVVILSSQKRIDLIERAKRAGAKGWLVKPFKGEQLVAVVQKLTGGSPGRV